MKIKTIEIEQLFGVPGNNFKIDLYDDITLVYALNGVGKSTLLKLIDGALTFKFQILDSIPFKKLSIKFEGEKVLTVLKPLIKPFDNLTIDEFYTKDGKNSNYVYPIEYQYNWPKSEYGDLKLKGRIYFSKKITENINEGKKKDDKLTFYDITGYKHKHFEYWNASNCFDYSDENLTDPLGEIEHVDMFDFEIRRIAKCISSLSVKTLLANKDYSRDINKLGRNINKYNSDVMELNDVSRQSRIGPNLNIFSNYDLTDTIYINYKSLIDTLLQFKSIVDVQGDMPFNQFLEFDSSRQYDFLKCKMPYKLQDKISYIKDEMKEKYEYNTMFALDNTALDNKVKLFLDIINNKPGLTDKDLEITKDGEFKVHVLQHEDINLTLEQLSSGEKNLILLYYEIIFNVVNSSLILIDEPEVSLHIDWQEALIDNINDYVKENNIQVIMATHSPNIVNEHWENLSEMKKEE